MNFFRHLLLFIVFVASGFCTTGYAQSYPIVLPKSAIFLSPSTGTFLVGSTFDVSLYLDTRGNNVNAVEANVKFPPDKLQIIKPSSGKSLIALWVAQPSYSNKEGTASFTGIIPNGVTTAAGLITTLTFKVIGTGEAVVKLLPNSKVLSNDGVGTETLANLGKGVYTLSPKPPLGPRPFSQTHPFEDTWYNNNSPVINWEKEAGVTDFSFTLDDKPGTIPDNISDSAETVKAYENLGDGIWYFHIKARKERIWGSTSDFVIRIDTAPPSEFKPKAEILRAALANKVLIDFFTTDALSGVDHYEVGVINKETPNQQSPVFIQSESPYQLPIKSSGEVRAVVRVFDKAGNVRDEYLDVFVPSSFSSFIYRNATVIIIIILVIGFLLVHFFFGHHITVRLKKAFYAFEGKSKKKGS